LNVTISANVADLEGGGAYVGGLLTLHNATVAGNASLLGGGLSVAGPATTIIYNTILANSAAGGNCGGAITSSQYTLSSDNTCALAGPGDQNGVDPLISTLGYFGSTTPVHLLKPGSPAIDGVVGNKAPLYDQRGVPRPQGAGYDIGAVERLPTDTDIVPRLYLPSLSR
jgi:hypothetical protein